jgi:hypothetical protein
MDSATSRISTPPASAGGLMLQDSDGFSALAELELMHEET